MNSKHMGRMGALTSLPALLNHPHDHWLELMRTTPERQRKQILTSETVIPRQGEGENEKKKKKSVCHCKP